MEKRAENGSYSNRGEKWQYSGGSQDINGVSSGALYLYRAAEQAEGYINVV